jgi:hypothetical protein
MNSREETEPVPNLRESVGTTWPEVAAKSRLFFAVLQNRRNNAMMQPR